MAEKVQEQIESPESVIDSPGNNTDWMIAAVPINLAALTIVLFNERFSTDWFLDSEVSLFIVIMGVLVGLASGIRRHPKKFLAPVSIWYFFLVLGLTIISLLLVFQATILNALISMVSRFDNGPVLLFFGATLIGAQCALLGASFRVAVGWRQNSGNSGDVTRDRLLHLAPSVSELRRRLLRLTSSRHS